MGTLVVGGTSSWRAMATTALIGGCVSFAAAAQPADISIEDPARDDEKTITCDLVSYSADDSLGPEAVTRLVDAALDSSYAEGCVPALEYVRAGAVDRLLRELDDPASQRHIRALKLLAELHEPRAIASLRRVLTTSSNADERGEALRVIGVLRAEEAVPDLERLLREPSPKLRPHTIAALADINTDRARAAIVAYLNQTTDPRRIRIAITDDLQQRRDPRLSALGQQYAPWFQSRSWTRFMAPRSFLLDASIVVLLVSLMFGATRLARARARWRAPDSDRQ